MTTTEQPIDLLKPDPANPRRITPEALTGLGVSMETFGDLSSVVWNSRTGRLVAGHQRMEQLRAAGVTTWRRNDNGGEIVHPKTGERFAVRIVDWDETTERVANLTANNPELQGSYTPDALAQLKAIDDDVDYAGLRLDALQATLEAGVPVEPAAGKTDPDEVPEVPKVPVTRPGDLWVMGEHRLLCGDSTKAEDVARLMGGERAGLMATDPPYGVAYMAVTRGRINQKAEGVFEDIPNDADDPEALVKLLNGFLPLAMKRLAPNAAIYVWHHDGEIKEVFRRALGEAGVLIYRSIIWRKPRFVFSRLGMYHYQHEPCFYGWQRSKIPPWYGEKNQTSIWEVGRDDGIAMHPTQKPVELFRIPMANHTKKGEVCYEPFSGSGSQIIAGEQLGRRVFALEIDPRFVDVAVNRWEAFTGKKATREQAIREPTPKPAPRAPKAPRPKPTTKPRRK